MGLDQNEFIQAFLIALKDQSVAKQLDESLGGQLKFEVGKLTDVSNKLSDELSSFRDINTQLQKEVSELREIVKAKDNKISVLEDKVENLEIKLDEHEQYSRRNSLRISGISEEENEVIGPKIMNFLNNKLGLSSPVESDQVDRIHRVGKPKGEGPRAALIKFATYGTRNRVFKSRWNLKTASHVSEDGSQNTPIYIN